MVIWIFIIFTLPAVEKGEVIALLDIAICLYEAMHIWRGQLRRESDFAMNFDYTISQYEPCIDKVTLYRDFALWMHI
ncbi:hypothetical protein SASPL_114237 [Salvia splendens]|uniref:Uncharacterized protein n=1 Tax=Salvia splendens TaxID=180675 RepID=A0A8X8Y3E1_SALSN|nr:hypothetical protein SASPL_114237 [Salvia splendens]